MEMRRTKKKKQARRKPLRTQREVLCDVMFSAAECETWLTLQELAALTHYGEASISAQLRNLRKPRYGGFLLEKRRREADEVVRRDVGVVWEYKLRRVIRRRIFAGVAVRGTSAAVLQPVAC
jgi:hypothetical protein